MKKILATALTAATLLAGGVAAAAPASAADYLQSGIAIRASYTNLNSTIYGRGYPGQGATRISQPVTLVGAKYSFSNKRYGTGTSHVWAKNKNKATGVTGFSGTYFIG